MNGMIDIYCERTGPGLWAEPLNLLSNAGFFIAAFFAWRLARRENALNSDTMLLIILLLLIGAGSALFHSFATRWAALSDTIPILLFQLAWLTLYARRVIGLKMMGAALLLGGFAAAVFAFGQLPAHMANGSLSYAPALLFLAGTGFYHWGHAGRDRWALPAAAGIFALSLSLRSADMAVCPVFPLGLHYFWHILNACVLYLTLRAYMRNANLEKRV